MRVGDLVQHVEFKRHWGVIVEIDSSSHPKGSLKILWHDGDISRMGAWEMEVVNEIQSR